MAERDGRATEAVKQVFATAEVAPMLRVLEEQYGETTYSLSSLFRDPQRQILDVLSGAALQAAEDANRAVYQQHAPLLMFLSGLGVPAPKAFRSAAELVLNADLRATLAGELPGPEKVKPLLEAVARTGIELDHAGLAYVFGQTLERLSDELAAKPRKQKVLHGLLTAASLLPDLPFAVDLRRTQNNYHRMHSEVFPAMAKQRDQGAPAAKRWVDDFLQLGGFLSMRTG